MPIFRHVLNAKADPKRGPQWCPSKVWLPTPGALRKPNASKQSRLPADCGWFVGDMGRVYHPSLVGNLEKHTWFSDFFPIHSMFGGVAWILGMPRNSYHDTCSLVSFCCRENPPVLWLLKESTVESKKNDEFHHFPVGNNMGNWSSKANVFIIFQVQSHLPIPLFLEGKDRAAPGTSRRHEAMVWRTVQRGRRLRPYAGADKARERAEWSKIQSMDWFSRENLQEKTHIFAGKSHGFRLRFGSLKKPMHWSNFHLFSQSCQQPPSPTFRTSKKMFKCLYWNCWG